MESGCAVKLELSDRGRLIVPISNFAAQVLQCVNSHMPQGEHHDQVVGTGGTTVIGTKQHARANNPRHTARVGNTRSGNASVAKFLN